LLSSQHYGILHPANNHQPSSLSRRILLPLFFILQGHHDIDEERTENGKEKIAFTFPFIANYYALVILVRQNPPKEKRARGYIVVLFFGDSPL